ncbi:PREDICTED: F-box only protein 6-like isoform X1 [Lupinus angustifolius]|nr:PREDICTED: F-box only protein 6-like isoform X1 [Lupinus angustifolius]
MEQQQQHMPLLTHFHPRQFFLDIDNNSVDSCSDLSMTAGSFRVMELPKHPSTKKSRRNQSRGKSSSRPFMDQQVWKDFPEDLFEAVIARLPIATFFRFRAVCQRWNSLLTSKSFSQHCAEVPQENPWFYTVTRECLNSGVMYDPSVKKWHHHTFSTRPVLYDIPVASAGGLICFTGFDHRDYCVCNPLTQSFTELPIRPIKSHSQCCRAVGMTVNGNSTDAGYKILLVNANGDYEIYDSLRKSWSHQGNMPASIKRPMTVNFGSRVSIDSTIYFTRSYPEAIISYDMATEVWKQNITPLPSHVIDHALAEYNGRIMLVGLLGKNAATCVCIWELQQMTLLWKEVDRMPNEWCLDFYGKAVMMKCLGNKGGLLMLSLRSTFSMTSVLVNRLVSYNMASREWLQVPTCKVPGGRKRQWVSYGTAFYPSLTSTA